MNSVPLWFNCIRSPDFSVYSLRCPLPPHFSSATFDANLHRAAEGDHESFGALIREHQDMVFSIAWHFLHDRDRAEEIAQEVFLQLYRTLGEIESTGASHLLAAPRHRQPLHRRIAARTLAHRHAR